MDINQYRNTCILNYIAAGYSLFPCSKDKRPLMKGWQATHWDHTLNTNTLPAAYGILLTSNDLVLDYDPRRNEQGQNQLQEFWELLQLPHNLQTYIVKTPGGGLHIYLAKPVTMPIKRMYAQQFKAIELKSAGRYVIGAGSVINGKVYKVIRGDPQQLASITDL